MPQIHLGQIPYALTVRSLEDDSLCESQKAQTPIMTSNHLRNLALAVLLVTPLLLVTPSRACGYADPGTGAFVYQAAYAAFLGGTFYLRRLLNRFWKKRK
jgi:hypothetical protein